MRASGQMHSPTAKIGRLSQAGLWESPLNFSDRVIETWLLVYCVTYSAFPHEIQREVATKVDHKGNKKSLSLAGCAVAEDIWPDQRDATKMWRRKNPEEKGSSWFSITWSNLKNELTMVMCHRGIESTFSFAWLLLEIEGPVRVEHYCW